MVFSTLHTLDASKPSTVIIAVFPPPEQKQVRLQLAAILRAIISSAWSSVPTPTAVCRGGSHDQHGVHS